MFLQAEHPLTVFDQGRAEADSLLRAHGVALKERDEAAALFEAAVASLRETEQV
jgi:3-hydroxyisobutyrate dehydrogenase-like beta-hydroxyacid dehydrogenase